MVNIKEQKFIATRISMIALLSDVTQTLLYTVKDQMKQEYKQEIELSIKRSKRLMHKFRGLIKEMAKNENGKIDQDKLEKIESDFDDDSELLLDFMFAAANAERQGYRHEIKNMINKFIKHD